ncbi:glycine-rich protein 1-like [Prunus yedoensis var. nudiflora]|uniref:Glycine-rich protein 1-like n=1 Tax=Prunus yedoensis var. nudiflora TaxID=2094558 RepID=A0A314U8J9_PRUYE|nr:glycine-rich protein 1-like [Prunus yedoensis var. nudiflora]
MATNPGTENLFETAPFGAAAFEGDPETEEEGEAAGKDDGGEGGESATGDVEGAAEGGMPKGEGEALKGEGEAAGGVLKGEGAEACLVESAGDLAGEDAGDCALVEATKRAATSVKTTARDRAIVDGEKSEDSLRNKLLSEGWV